MTEDDILASMMRRFLHDDHWGFVALSVGLKKTTLAIEKSVSLSAPESETIKRILESSRTA